MRENAEVLAPRARRHGLVTRELDSEVIIFDRESNQAHALAGDAALVWRKCDGATSIAEIATFLGQSTGRAPSEDDVWRVLLELGELGLLDEQVSRSADSTTMSRRRMMLKAGVAIGAGVTLPLISSIPVALADSCNSECKFVSSHPTGSADGCLSRVTSQGNCGPCSVFENGDWTGAPCDCAGPGPCNCKCAPPGCPHPCPATASCPAPCCVDANQTCPSA